MTRYDERMTTATKANAIGTCPCGAITTVSDVWNLWRTDEDADRLWQTYRRIVCRDCGRNIPAASVVAKAGKCACGSWCTEGTGRTCTCECGGANHGAKYAPGTLFYLH
jgi:hypothetical protein